MLTVAFLSRKQQGFVTFELAFKMSPRDDIAVLKARTLLAFAHSRDLLEMTENNSWVIYHIKSANTADIVSLSATLPADVNIDAVIGIDYNQGSPGQPGIIAVRNDPIARTIFTNAFLASSISWLESRPADTAELVEAFKHEERKAG